MSYIYTGIWTPCYIHAHANPTKIGPNYIYFYLNFLHRK